MRLLLLSLLLGACAKPVLGGAPQPIILPENANPDVIWMVRPFVTERDGAGQVELWGLFACYRMAEPGPPQCFLAQSAGTEEALVWPDDAKRYRISP
jgi:hypothetical protein